MTEDQVRAARLLVSGKVRALLARHGVSDSQQQLATLMTLMNASHSQVYRKLSGRSSWLEEDLMRIAEHHGETLGTLFRDEAAPSAAHSVGRPAADAIDLVWHEAQVEVGGKRVPCQVNLLVPDDANMAEQDALLLWDTPQGPFVGWADAPTGAREHHTVRGTVAALRIDLDAPPDGGYAVFDDDPDVADAIVDNLLARGLRASAFYTTQDLRASPRRFDTYIVDWFSSDRTTAADLVKYLRDTHAPEATIVILTGQIQRDTAESDLSKLIRTHDVMVELKPIRVDLLLAKIAHARQAG